MTSIRHVVRAQLKAGLKPSLALIALVAVLGGITLAAAAGARRTETSYARMLQTYPGPDVIIPNVPDPSGRTAVFDAKTVRAIPGVRLVSGTEPLVIMIHGTPTVCVAHIDPHLGDKNAVLSYKVLQGRQANPGRLDEATVNYVAAQRLNLHVGEQLPLQLVTPFDKLLVHPGVRLPTTVRIVGSYAGPSEIIGAEQDVPALHFSAAFAHLFPPFVFPSLLVALDGGPSAVPAFVSQLDARAHGKRVQIIEAHASDRDTQHAIHGEAVGLWLLAGLLLVTGLLIVAQTLIRETYVEGRDDHVLASLGMTRLQLWTRTMLRALIILVAGSLGALGVMYVISPLMPIGIARLAEPAPGLSFDALVAGAGVAALIALPMLVLAAPAFLAVHVGNTEKSAKPRARHPFQGGSLPLPIALGSALAFDRRKGAGALPVRTTIGSLTVAFAGLAAALVFGASLSHLLGTPRAYGLTWDTAIGSATRDARAAEPILRSDTRVQGLAFGVTAVAFQIDGHAVDAELIDPPVKGPTATVVLAGRAPAGAAELALGTRTMRDLHLRIGEVVSAGLPGGLAEHMRIVGRVVLEPANTGPQTAFVTAQELRLGDGALTTYSNFDPREQRALPPAQAFIRFASGVNRAATDASSVKAIGGDAGVTNFVSPRDLIVIGRLQNLPFALTAVLALVAVSTLVHMLLAGVHRRRREYAILKTLGLAGRQMISTIICQADFLAVLAVIFGMLIGVVGGRWLWNLLVGGEGVVTEPRLPTTGLGVAAVAMIVVSTIFALGPAIVAERVSPATVLRVE